MEKKVEQINDTEIELRIKSKKELLEIELKTLCDKIQIIKTELNKYNSILKVLNQQEPIQDSRQAKQAIIKILLDNLKTNETITRKKIESILSSNQISVNSYVLTNYIHHLKKHNFFTQPSRGLFKYTGKTLE